AGDDAGAHSARRAADLRRHLQLFADPRPLDAAARPDAARHRFSAAAGPDRLGHPQGLALAGFAPPPPSARGGYGVTAPSVRGHPSRLGYRLAPQDEVVDVTLGLQPAPPRGEARAERAANHGNALSA